MDGVADELQERLDALQQEEKELSQQQQAIEKEKFSKNATASLPRVNDEKAREIALRAERLKEQQRARKIALELQQAIINQRRKMNTNESKMIRKKLEIERFAKASHEQCKEQARGRDQSAN